MTAGIAPAALAISAAAYSPTLPGRIAIHFDSNGAPDGYGSPWPLLAFAAVAAIVSVTLSVGTIIRTDGRTAALTCFAVQAVANCLVTAWIAVARTAHAHDSHLGLATMLGLIVIAIGIALVPFGLMRSTAPIPEPVAVEPLLLAPSERAAYSGRSGSPVILILGAAVTLLGISLLITTLSGETTTSATSVAIDILVAVVGVALGGLSRVVVSVDSRGLRVSTAILAIPLIREPLSNVKSCALTTTGVAEWGGWGFRIAPRGSAYIANSGPALIAELNSGRIRMVSLPDPEEAASVLNALLQRRDHSFS